MLRKKGQGNARGNGFVPCLCTDPSSKGGKGRGLWNNEPKLAELSRNSFWRPRNESLNSTDSRVVSFSMAFISLFSNFSCKVFFQCFKLRRQINKDKRIF